MVPYTPRPVNALATAGMLLLLAAPPLRAAPETPHPLDRVPASAEVFAHLSAGNLWDHPTVVTLRKAFAKELDEVLAKAEKELGLRPEQIASLTFHFPKFPQGPGDEQLFVLQVVTRKPYDSATLLTGLRPKGEMPKGQVVRLTAQMILHLTGDTQFTVLHESLLDDFLKRPSKAGDGAMKDALQAARDGKNALVFGLDPSGLPAELFTAAPPELQPFLPLLKARSIVVQARLDRDLSAAVRFTCDTEDRAIEVERSFNLLMKLADDGLTDVLKDEAVPDELKALVPALTEVQKMVRQVKADRRGTVVTATAAIKADPELAKPLVGLVLGPQAGPARTVSQNNLKQIGIALHNYHDTNTVLPPAAIVDKKGKPLLSWRVAILPYIDQEALYRQFKLDEPWDSPHNLPLSKIVVRAYQLPYGEPKPGITHYRAFVGNGSAFDLIQGSKLTEFADGTSNTLLVVEAAEGVPWTKPDDLAFDPDQPMLKHLRFENDRCNILMGDGSVRAVSKKLTDDVLKLLIQKGDGMPIPDLD